MNRLALLAGLAPLPWAMHPRFLNLYSMAIKQQIEAGRIESHGIERADRMTRVDDKKTAEKDGSVVVLPIQGAILNRSTDIDPICPEGTAVERLQANFMKAMNNSEVKAIILDVNSPGGTIGGVPEFAQMIRDARGQKPITAVVNDGAFSAGYWLASAATELVMTPSSQVGSIGVYSMHQDISKYMQDKGINVSFIQAGKYKTEGNPFEPLSYEAKAEMQTHIDQYYAQFIGDVAANRKTSAKKVEENYGQGRIFSAKDALANGMVDRIGTMQETLARFGVSAYSGAARRRVATAQRERELALIETGD